MQTSLGRFLVALEFHDKLLACSDCAEQFVFSASEQTFYQQKSLQNEPKRCPNCRIISRLRRDGVDPKQTAEVCCVDAPPLLACLLYLAGISQSIAQHASTPKRNHYEKLMDKAKSQHPAHFLSRLIDALSPCVGEDIGLADLLEEARSLRNDCLHQDLSIDDEAAYFRLELRRLVRDQKLQHLPDAEKAAQTLESVFSQLASHTLDKASQT